MLIIYFNYIIWIVCDQLILIYCLAFYNERPKYVKKCHEIISNKYPDKMAIILKKQNTTTKVGSQENLIEETDMEFNYLNEALCKMSKSIFFDHKISFCSNNDDKTRKKK